MGQTGREMQLGKFFILEELSDCAITQLLSYAPNSWLLNFRDLFYWLDPSLWTSGLFWVGNDVSHFPPKMSFECMLKL